MSGNVTKVDKRQANGKKQEDKREVPGRAALTGAANRITDRSPDKALRAAIRGGSGSVSRMTVLITAAGLRNRQAKLPDGHGVVGAVVVAGDGVEVRQPVPVLIAGADVEAQQAGLLMVAQRLGRG